MYLKLVTAATSLVNISPDLQHTIQFLLPHKVDTEYILLQLICVLSEKHTVVSSLSLMTSRTIFVVMGFEMLQRSSATFYLSVQATLKFNFLTVFYHH